MFHFGTSKRGGRKYLPYAFTEQGIAMLSSVLKSLIKEEEKPKRRIVSY